MILFPAESRGKIPALLKLMGVSPLDAAGLGFHSDPAAIKLVLLTSEQKGCARYAQHGGSGLSQQAFQSAERLPPTLTRAEMDG